MSGACHHLWRPRARWLLSPLPRGWRRLGAFVCLLCCSTVWLAYAYWSGLLSYPQRRTGQNSGMFGRSSLIDRSFILNVSSFENLESKDDADVYKCVGGPKHWPVEDIFCLPRPRFEPKLKNPCWYEEVEGGKKRLRCLPYFHLLGVDKSGSTDLFHRLSQHPQILPNNGMLGKEVYFWCWLRYGRWYFERQLLSIQNLTYYLNMFSSAASAIDEAYRNNSSVLITGDATPMTFWEMTDWPQIPQNFGRGKPLVTTPHLMKHLYPSTAKFIVIFRDPVERLYSDYYFVGSGDNRETFHKHVTQGITTLQRCFNELSPHHCLFSYEIQRQLPLRMTIGCYSVFLREWFSVFPRESFLILRTKDYSKHMLSHLQRAFQFLDVEPLPHDLLKVLTELPTAHETQFKKHQGPMRNDTRKLLEDFYRPFNQDLANLLNDPRYLWED